MSESSGGFKTYQFSENDLRKLMAEVKSDDMGRAQFEREKTERIKALCELLPKCQPEAYRDGERSKVFGWLEKAIASRYTPCGQIEGQMW